MLEGAKLIGAIALAGAAVGKRNDVGRSNRTYKIMRVNECTRLNWPREDCRYGFIIWCRRYGDSSESEDENFTFKVSPKEKERESSSQTIDCWRNKKDQAFSVPLGQPETEGFRSHPSRPSSPLSRAQETQATSEERKREEGSPSWREDTCEIKDDNSTLERDRDEAGFQGTSEAPKTSEALSQNPFSELEMKEILERLDRHNSLRQVGDNRPSVPEPSKKSSWWESFWCLCQRPTTKDETSSGNEGNGRDTDTGSGENDLGPGE